MIPSIPLAERIRPKTRDDFLGQKHLVGKNSVIRKMIESGNLQSFILWGPPGVGKTTLAKIIANQLNRAFYTLSAINSGVKDVRETFEKAKKQQFFNNPSPVLFIDEIHRFNKSQQDSLLGAVEQGVITLIGATTENPSFELNSSLLSRVKVYMLHPLSFEDMQHILERAITSDKGLANDYKVTPEALERLKELTDGLSPLVVYFVGRERSFAWIDAGGELTVQKLADSEELQRLLLPVRADLARPGRPGDAAAPV